MKTEIEKFKKALRKEALKVNGLPNFEMPIVHIHKEPKDDFADVLCQFTACVMTIREEQQKETTKQIMEEVNKIMKKKGITELYGINEHRLLEIIEEAQALEIIKKYLEVCEVYNGYLLTDGNGGETYITKEEYDLLREVLL